MMWRARGTRRGYPTSPAPGPLAGFGSPGAHHDRHKDGGRGPATAEQQRERHARLRLAVDGVRRPRVEPEGACHVLLPEGLEVHRVPAPAPPGAGDNQTGSCCRLAGHRINHQPFPRSTEHYRPVGRRWLGGEYAAGSPRQQPEQVVAEQALGPDPCSWPDGDERSGRPSPPRVTDGLGLADLQRCPAGAGAVSGRRGVAAGIGGRSFSRGRWLPRRLRRRSARRPSRAVAASRTRIGRSRIVPTSPLACRDPVGYGAVHTATCGTPWTRSTSRPPYAVRRPRQRLRRGGDAAVELPGGGDRVAKVFAHRLDRRVGAVPVWGAGVHCDQVQLELLPDRLLDVYQHVREEPGQLGKLIEQPVSVKTYRHPGRSTSPLPAAERPRPGLDCAVSPRPRRVSAWPLVISLQRSAADGTPRVP